MPYASNIYSLPAGTAAVTGQEANADHVNERFEDLAQAQNRPRPVTAGGTGQTSIASVQGRFKIPPYNKAATVTGNWTFTGDLDLSGATITGTAVDDSGIVTAKLANDAVTRAKISDGAVTRAKLVDGVVNTDKLANDAVNTDKIANDVVTRAKLANDAVTRAKISDGAVTRAKLVDGVVNTDKLANDAVTGAKLADDAVTRAKISDGAVSRAKLVNGAVNTDKLANDAVTNSKIATGTISKNRLKPTMLSGNEAKIITGTPGASDRLTQWNGAGDLVSTNRSASDVFKPVGYIEFHAGGNTNGSILYTKSWQIAVSTTKNITTHLGGRIRKTNYTSSQTIQVRAGESYTRIEIYRSTGSH